MQIDFSKNIPMHQQLKDILMQKIDEGELVNKLPSERELMRIYNVSRSTVRQSIQQLVSAGLIEKRPGKGNYITKRTINEWLGGLTTVNEAIIKKKMLPRIKLVENKGIILDEALQKSTHFRKAIHIKRVRYANNMPLGIEYYYFPVEFKDKLAFYNLKTVAIYELLDREFGKDTIFADQVIQSTTLTNEDADLLNLDKNHHALATTRKIMTTNNQVICFERAFYHPQLYEFHLSLSRVASGTKKHN